MLSASLTLLFHLAECTAVKFVLPFYEIFAESACVVVQHRTKKISLHLNHYPILRIVIRYADFYKQTFAMCSMIDAILSLVNQCFRSFPHAFPPDRHCIFLAH